jgi:hypothetical protein
MKVQLASATLKQQQPGQARHGTGVSQKLPSIRRVRWQALIARRDHGRAHERFRSRCLRITIGKRYRAQASGWCSKFRIDLAAAHPRQPGRFVLASECDGATYHSSYTAKRRERRLSELIWTIAENFGLNQRAMGFLLRPSSQYRSIQAVRCPLSDHNSGKKLSSSKGSSVR